MAAPSTQYDHLAGIKEASWMTEYFFDVARRTSELPRKFAVFAGIEHLVQTMPLGGCGAFSLLTVVFPDLIRELYALCERGGYAAAKPLQYQVSQLLLTIKHQQRRRIELLHLSLTTELQGHRQFLIALLPFRLRFLDRDVRLQAGDGGHVDQCFQ